MRRELSKEGMFQQAGGALGVSLKYGKIRQELGEGTP